MPELATKDDLEQVETSVRGEITRVDSSVRGEMTEMRRELSWEIGHAVNAIGELVRGQIRVVDDKYQDLPERVRRLEERDRGQ